MEHLYYAENNFINFIDVPPSERFKAITDLIGIDSLTNIEKEMR